MYSACDPPFSDSRLTTDYQKPVSSGALPGGYPFAPAQQNANNAGAQQRHGPRNQEHHKARQNRNKGHGWQGSPMSAQYLSNPVGALQERFQSRGLTPLYTVVHHDGASHCPTFSFEVTIGEYVANGTGSSKKQAKHNAARALLDKLDGRSTATEDSNNQVGSNNITKTNIASDSASTRTSTVNDTPGEAKKATANGTQVPPVGVGNTIGQLQEICVHQGLPMPIYDLETVSGQPHQRSFTINVKVGQLKAEGEGTSKKEAKRDAATKMITLIKKDNNKVSDHKEVTKDDEELAKRVENMKISSITPTHSLHIQQFYQNLQDKQCSKLFVLHRTPLNSPRADYKLLLEELAQEQKFEVTYVEMEDKNDEGKIQCLVQLSTLPVAVCYGVGDSKEKACQEAARIALNYLKMMTKKTDKANGN